MDKWLRSRHGWRGSRRRWCGSRGERRRDAEWLQEAANDVSSFECHCYYTGSLITFVIWLARNRPLERSVDFADHTSCLVHLLL